LGGVTGKKREILKNERKTNKKKPDCALKVEFAPKIKQKLKVK